MYFVSHKKSSFQVLRNLKSLGNFRGLGAFFSFFASIDRELKSLHICVPISVKFARIQDLVLALRPARTGVPPVRVNTASWRPCDQNPGTMNWPLEKFNQRQGG